MKSSRSAHWSSDNLILDQKPAMRLSCVSLSHTRRPVGVYLGLGAIVSEMRETKYFNLENVEVLS